MEAADRREADAVNPERLSLVNDLDVTPTLTVLRYGVVREESSNSLSKAVFSKRGGV